MFSFKSIIYLWGKIFAEERDYIILEAKSLNHFEIVKKWFFSQDEGLSFAELPPIEEWITNQCSTIFSPLTGTSSYIYQEKIKPKDGTAEENENAEEETKPVEESPILTELHRLSNMVNNISNDCFIAPHESIRLTTKKEFIKNIHYKGLTHEKARSLQSYVHLRQPELQKIYDANTFTQTNEILDKIIDDMPPNVWRIYSRDNGATILRNLQWPGFEFKTNAHSSIFEQCYFGNGIPRKEINWMIAQISEI